MTNMVTWAGLNTPIAPYNPPKMGTSGENQRIKLNQKQGGLCAYCDLPFTEMDPATLDHIVPKSRGGSNKIRNKALVHSSCNQMKGDLISYTEALHRAKRFIDLATMLKKKGYLQE